MQLSQNILKEILIRSELKTLITYNRYKHLDYKIFTLLNSGMGVIFVEGSNEGRDWIINFLGFILFPFLLFHPGYWIKAKHLHEMINRFYSEDDFILAGYSYGAAIITIYRAWYGRANNHVLYTIAYACPPCLGWFNPIFLTWDRDRYINYNKPDDITLYTSLAWPYRKAWFPKLLKRTGWNLIRGHLKKNYIKSFIK